MKKAWIFSTLALVCLATVVAIFYKSHNRGTVTDAGPAELSKEPARIVSLAPNLTEILFALGLEGKIVAVSSDSDYPPEAADVNKIGTFWQPSTEAVIAARPDLVVTLAFGQQQAVADTLRRLGINVLTVKIDKVQELFAAVEQIGAAARCRQRADELVKATKDRIRDLQSLLGATGRVKVLWVVQAEPVRVAGRNTFVNELIELAGGKNAIGSTIQQYPQMGTEELLGCGAETIIQSAMGTEHLVRQQQAAETFWRKFENLPAVKGNRIHVVQPDTVLRLGPRLPQGIELIARHLHPGIFAQTGGAAQRAR